MNILLASATSHEIAPLIKWLDQEYEHIEGGVFRIDEEVSIFPLITGVGMLPAGFALSKSIQQLNPDLVLQAGLGGALNDDFTPGDVVQITSEQIADLGAQDQDDSFLSVFDLGLTDPDQPPFRDGKLKQPDDNDYDFLPVARGISVNTVHGEKKSIKRLNERIEADVESQEGAALFYVCLMEDISFLEIRAISNYVEARDRYNWHIEKALDALNDSLKSIIASIASE